MTKGLLIAGLIAFLGAAGACDDGAADDGLDAGPDFADATDSAEVLDAGDTSDAVEAADEADGAPDATDGAGCEPTAANILGPYYIEGAPERSDLVEPGMAGTRLTVTGRVLAADCTPIPGAMLDVWQANADGVYDNTGWLLRGWFLADAAGEWTLHTIVPGRYATGGTFRPDHIHVRVSAAGFLLLTTQLYFADDPFNATDPFFVPSLAMTTTVQPDGSLSATFDFVLSTE